MNLNEFVELYYKANNGITDHLTVVDTEHKEQVIFKGTPAQFIRSVRHKKHDSEVTGYCFLPRFNARFEITPTSETEPVIRNINTGVELYVYIKHCK